jgi:hypothetical protein
MKATIAFVKSVVMAMKLVVAVAAAQRCKRQSLSLKWSQ